MNVPASRVVTLFVDALTADWKKYTVQFNTETLGSMVSQFNQIFSDKLTFLDHYLKYSRGAHHRQEC
jgi:hypothetical protein